MEGKHTDIIEDVEFIDSGKTSVGDAVRYLTHKDFPLLMPSKSRVVAILYARLLEQVYGIDFYEALNDPELLPDDSFFLPYEKDKEGYDLLLAELPPIEHWVDMGGWAERTIKYFWLECTDDGINFICSASQEELMEFLENAECPLKISIH